MWLRKHALTLIGIVGAALLIWGNWIYFKAVIADALLERAWAEAVETGQPVTPWQSMDASLSARLIVPDLDVSQIVLNKASGQALAFAPAMVDGSARPGQIGMTAVAAHKNTHFAFLEKVKPGQQVALEMIDGSVFHYAIEKSFVFDSRHDVLPQTTDREGLLLITCYPFDAVSFNGPLRYVVSAVPVLN